MPCKRVIAKPKRGGAPRKPDLLTSLPPDVQARVIDALPDTALRGVPDVSPSWRALFVDAATAAHFRALVRRRFGLRENATHPTWGLLYLALRAERCHLCPAPDVAPFVYAATPSLGPLGGHERLALFPVCRACFRALMRGGCDPFVPVVERRAVAVVFPGQEARPVDVETGYLYSDIPAVRGGDHVCGVQYALARQFARDAR